MKHCLNKSLLVLACAIGLTATPQVHSFPAAAAIAQKAGAVLVAYEIANLLFMVKRGSKPDFKQRALLDISKELLKENKEQWAKNVLKNIEIVHVDYIQGQTFKGQGLSVDPEGKVISGQKCLPAGFNGNLFGWLAAINKTSKSVKDVAILAAAILFIGKVEPLKASEKNRFAKLAELFGWSVEKTDLQKELLKLKLAKARREEKAATATDTGAGATDAGAENTGVGAAVAI